MLCFHLLVARNSENPHQCASTWMNDSSSLLFLPRPSSPSTASPFCLGSAVSLSAFFNNGAMPCACHEAGAESDTCEAFGGQCRCRPNVIGRDCSMCATGYWGFPNCRRECQIVWVNVKYLPLVTLIINVYIFFLTKFNKTNTVSAWTNKF